MCSCVHTKYYAQDFMGSPTPNIIKIDFKLPTAIANQPFKTFFNGIIDSDLSYQRMFLNGKLGIGIGFKYSNWQIITTKFQNIEVNGFMHKLTPFVSASYIRETTEITFFEFELKGGYTTHLTQSNRNPIAYMQQGIAIEPKVGFYLRANELTAVGITANYVFAKGIFTQDNLYLSNNLPGYNNVDISQNYSYFSIGLGAFLTIPSFKR